MNRPTDCEQEGDDLMFAPNIVTVTINDIEGGIIMFALIIATITLIIIAAIVAAFVVLSLTDYDLARSIVDAIPVDVDAFDAAVARIPGNMKRLAKTTKTTTKEAWHTTVTIASDIVWAIGAIAWLSGIVFAGICEDIADFIGSGNAIIDAVYNRLPKTVVDIDGVIYKFPFADGDQNKKQRLHRIWIIATFPFWRFGVSIKDAVKLAIDFIDAAWRYAKAHAPGLMTAIQVGTWNAITNVVNAIVRVVNAIVRAVKAIISAIKAIAHVVWEIIGIFAAIAKLIGWVSGGVGLDANKALTKVANSF